ncbi:MAG: glycosyltransferase family 2 protein [Anaerolineae bacterium]|nr:glycosyltransferase family 2 protein [Anaerolineae bacterium]
MIPDGFQLSVIMPVYNEHKTVLRVLERVRAVPVPKQVIIVDNCSTDGTREILQSIRADDVRVIYHPQNLGRGTSVRTGLAHCTGDYTITQGADLEYDPAEWPHLIEKALSEDLDAVFGSRTLGGRAVYVYLQNYLGVLGFNALINLLYGSHYTDCATECKMIRTPVFKGLGLQRSGFDLDFEICTRLALAHCSYGEVPISYHPRSIAEGKKLRAIRDGLAALRTILRDRVRAPRFPIARS